MEDEEAKSESAVWCYQHSGHDWEKYRKKLPRDVPVMVEFRPPHITPRITVQGGCFTVHPDQDQMVDGWQGELRLIKVPKDRRDPLREDLRKLGVDRSALFPDLDGIAIALNRHLSRQSENVG